MNLKAEYKF